MTIGIFIDGEKSFFIIFGKHIIADNIVQYIIIFIGIIVYTYTHPGKKKKIRTTFESVAAV